MILKHRFCIPEIESRCLKCLFYMYNKECRKNWVHIWQINVNKVDLTFCKNEMKNPFHEIMRVQVQYINYREYKKKLNLFFLHNGNSANAKLIISVDNLSFCWNFLSSECKINTWGYSLPINWNFMVFVPKFLFIRMVKMSLFNSGQFCFL